MNAVKESLLHVMYWYIAESFSANYMIAVLIVSVTVIRFLFLLGISTATLLISVVAENLAP